jgi:hypothetical protein
MSSRKRIGGLLLLGALAGLAAGIWLLRDFFGAAPAAGASAIDLLIERDDIYAVSRADLRRLGWGDVSPEDLRLETAGEPYPFFLREEGGDFWIVFYGRAPGDPDRRYTPQNVYRLFRDADAERTRRFNFQAEPANAETGVSSHVRAERMLEENGFYAPALEEGRPWFWQQLAAPGVITIPFDLEEPVDGEAVITTALVASTEAESADPDHHLIFTLNGTPVADETWDGAGPRTIEIRVAAETLRSDGNVLEIHAPGDTGIPAEIVLLDWVRIEYSRTAALDGGTLHFSAVGDQTGFSGIGSGPLVLFELLPGDGAPSLAWIEQTGGSVLPTVPGRAYAAGALADLPGPTGLRALPEGTDLRSHPGAAYLAIGAPDLLEPLEPLLEHREAGGLSTLAVPLETVYDQFGAGIRTPEAIRQFLVYAVENWEAVPQYVLLVGDWTYDPYGFTVAVPEYGLPSFFTYTEYGGETVSDVEFAKLDEDALPDLALGRFPARTPEQVEIVVDKTLAYETGAGGAWTHRVLAVADGSEARFSSDAAAFLNGFGDGFQPVLVEQTGDGRAVAVQIDRELTEGALIFSYFGHGSLTQLGKDGLFNTADAAALANGDFTPIMVNITCLAGLFTHPAVDSLTEAMLWNESGGVVAGLSATSLTLPAFQTFLSQALVDGIAAGPGHRLGEALLAAQRGMPVQLGRPATEVLETFLLFGDPALMLPLQTP